ncbi:arsenate reductase [Sporosarcina sp. P17b]|uniref:arsenate reductase/protein-tyrosine-phosphatase family protein n=1 Tax=Sporosarcina sp. P17b TaxID=2048260 RepID=UPI000C16EBF8|nr:arsenate reductase [Sporosarcina sp. P17b]PIC73389.1 arsenate reductase [Sporosarcina sp. P17b]
MTNNTIYFLCKGNSCRSQIAERWGGNIFGEEWHVLSAGIEAHGVDISDQTSGIVDQQILNNADFVLTLCGFDDLANAEGTKEEKWAFFQRVRDEIGANIERSSKVSGKAQ